MKQRELKWEIISSEYLIQRPWLTARRDAVRLPNDTVCEEYYVLEYPDWINVIAETVNGQILIERQYRHGHQSVNFEICAGVIESGETPLQAAQRELYEETGYTGGDDCSQSRLTDQSLPLFSCPRCRENKPTASRSYRRHRSLHLY